jgi:cell wall-associated NlpC family hydrolase
MEQKYGICRVAVAHVRAEAGDRSEMSSQLLFGDHVEVLEKEERWWKIKNAYEGYEGWMDFRQLAMIPQDEYLKNNECKDLVPLQIDNTLVAEDGSKYYLSAGSSLPQLQDGFCKLADQKYQLLFSPTQAPEAPEREMIRQTALFFQNVPYLWGGRTIFGLDCSGFVQTVYKINGVKLRRDAWQQAEDGTLVGFLPEVQLGDLAFFDNEEGRITHVGLMLSPNEIIHSSGKVRIDPIDDQGIYNKELGKYSHKLRIIKRYI